MGRARRGGRASRGVSAKGQPVGLHAPLSSPGEEKDTGVELKPLEKIKIH